MTVSLDKRTTYFRSKFDSARDDALYSLALDGMTDSSGDSEAPTGWFTAISVDADDLHSYVTGNFSWVKALDEMVEARERFDTLIGHFLVWGDAAGFIYVETFDTAEALEAAYDELDKRYSEWLGEEE